MKDFNRFSKIINKFKTNTKRMISGLIMGVTSAVQAGQAANDTLDSRAKKYADWILANVCNGNKNAIVGMAIEVNPRVDGFGIFGGGVFHTECRSMNWDAGYITLQGGDYTDAEEIWVQRVAKVNGVAILQL